MTVSSFRRPARLSAETLDADSAADAALKSRPPEEAPIYLAGEVVGDRYRLVRELGRGGMGVVWVAHSLVLDVDVAVKLIRGTAAGGGVASRMAREAHAAARLGHPALVRVFDFGWTSRKDPFLVMELVQGETLSAVLGRDGKVPAIRAVQTLLPVADGLRLAHDKSIVHRDIKPDNILIARDAFGRQQPKLLDFGIAKVGQTHDGKLTQLGTVLGSHEYMSPEQALGLDDIDERTDVWSLCVVLYELVTGTVPFKRANYNALMHAIINDTPPPAHEEGNADASLWLILERGLSKLPEQRWANMTELGEALALWLYEHGIKEDLSGNSLRAVWLDAALSGVRMDLPSSRPPLSGLHEAPALPRRPAPETPRTALDVTRAAEAPTRSSAAQDLPAPSRGRRRFLLAVLGAVAACVGALLGYVLLRRPPVEEAMAKPPASVSVAPSVGPVAAAAKVEPIQSAPAPVVAAPGSSTPRPSAPARRAGTASARPKATKRQHDFGF